MLGLPTTFVVAAIILAAGAATAFYFRLAQGQHLDLTPSKHWPTPPVSWEIEEDQGPVIVTIEYQVEPTKQNRFLEAARPLRTMRLREGAYRWSLVKDIEDETRLIETFTVGSWLEHLRQHERVTETDRQVEALIKKFHRSPEPPLVSHFVAVKT